LNEDPNPEKNPQGIFVTLWKVNGGREKNLRGCIGHLERHYVDLIQEVKECALAAAFQDHRFPPLEKDEFHEIMVEISLLHPYQQVKDISTLNPKVHGVVVQNEHHRGVLLPNIEGVNTVKEQLRIALSKGGFDSREPYEILSFQVTKLGPL